MLQKYNQTFFSFFNTFNSDPIRYLKCYVQNIL